jgi:hypothetical protein
MQRFNSTKYCTPLGARTMARPAKRKSVSVSEEPDDEVEESPVRDPKRLSPLYLPGLMRLMPIPGQAREARESERNPQP